MLPGKEANRVGLAPFPSAFSVTLEHVPKPHVYETVITASAMYVPTKGFA